MKALKNILIRILMSSGLFLNATAQDDVTGLRIPQEFKSNQERLFADIAERVNSTDFYSLVVTETVDHTMGYNSEVENESWIDSHSKIAITDLPKAIIKSLVKEYEVYAVLEVEKIKTSVREAYKIRVVQDDAQWDIYLDSRGNIIMEEKVS